MNKPFAFDLDAVVRDVMAMNEANARAYRLEDAVLPTVRPPQPPTAEAVETYEFADDEEVAPEVLGGQAWPVSGDEE